MSRLYLDYGFFAQKRRERRCIGVRSGRISRRLLIGGGLALFVLVFLAGLAYLQRRQLADAWRQYQVASIPPPPAVTQPVSTNTVNAQDPSQVKPESADGASAEASGSDSTDSDSAAGDTAATDDADGDSGPDDAASESGTAPATPETNGSDPAKTDSSLAPPAGPTNLPERANLDVPMVYQAPFNVWDTEHDDACEEASALMISNYWEGKRSLTRQEMEDQILALIDYQMDAFGFFKDTNAAQTVQFMKDYLGLERVAVLPVNSIDDIRRQIAAGRPVILPADGKALKNPNFRNGGPPYHMLVVKGYTEDNIISNDPGTRRGANWLYTNEIIMDAVHDWNGGDVKNGQPVMIVAW
jgi:hypothetical protein